MIRVRPATPDDAAEIADQYAELHRDQWSEGGEPLRADHDADWVAEVAAALTSTDTRLFVGEADGVVIATARIEFAERPHFRIADIRRVYVRPAWRRRGIGAELMRAAEDAAVAGGAAEVRLSVVTENEPALAFYRHLGYGNFAIRLSKRIRV